MEYVDGSMQYRYAVGENFDFSGWNKLEGHYDEKSRKLTAEILGLENRKAYIEVTYQTKVTNVSNNPNGSQVSFTNYVTVGNKTKSSTVTLDDRRLDKKAALVNGLDNVIEYTIGVNYGAQDLNPNSDTLELEDVLDANLTLDASSIVVTDMNTGESVSCSKTFGTSDSGGNTVTLTLPDERALCVTYRATLLSTGKENGKTYTVSNEAALNGETSVSKEIKTEVKYQTSNATVEGRSDSITIKKVDEEDSTKSLKGAAFILQKMKVDTTTQVNKSSISEDGNPIKKQTDDNGTLTFSELSYNTLYYYQETKAPDGYKITDKNKHYFVISNLEGTERQNEYDILCNKLETAQISFVTFQGANTITVSNEKITERLELTAKKVLTGGTLKDKEFSFVLKEGGEELQTKQNAADGSVTFDPITYDITDIGRHTYTVSEVKGTEAGVTYDDTEYVITVDVSDNGDGTLKADKTIKVKDKDENIAEITFTNKYVPPVPTITVLPTPEVTATVTPTPEATATPTPEATATPTPEATATPTPEATATPTPEATATPTPEATATPTPEATATPTPEATATPTPEATATPTPKITSTPKVTPTPEPVPEISVTKKLETLAGDVINAVDQTFYVALYSDADCTERVSDIKALAYKNANAATVTFTNVEEGITYYVGECTAEGVSVLSGVTADGTIYIAQFTDGNAVTVEETDGNKVIYFENQFEKIPDGFYREGILTVTKKLVNSEGKAKNSKEIFYAGIFADPNYEQFSDKVDINVVPLDLNGGNEVSAEVKVGIAEGSTVTLYVTEVDSDGNPVEDADFAYEVSVDSKEGVVFDSSNMTGTVVITNKEKATKKITPTPTPVTEITATPASSNSTIQATSAKTGDDTVIKGFVGMLAAAIMVIVAGAYIKRRRQNER